MLAAGTCSRLQPFTDDSPKCLTEINETTNLERLVCCLLVFGCSSESGTENGQPADDTNGGQAAATNADADAQADGGELLVPPSDELAGEPEPEEEGPEPIARPSLFLRILTDPLNDAMDAQIESLPGPARMFIPTSGRSREDPSEEPPQQGENEESEETSEPAGESEP